MSLTNFSTGGASSPKSPIPKVTMPALAEMKRQGKPICALTAYDYAKHSFQLNPSRVPSGGPPTRTLPQYGSMSGLATIGSESDNRLTSPSPTTLDPVHGG